MKRILAIAILVLTIACKETPKDVKPESKGATLHKSAVKTDYPENLVKIFEAHGGLKNWKTKRTLRYTIAKPTGAEIQTVDLYSRKEKIEMPQATMGFNGTNVWLLDEKGTYKGDPLFYKNLMFYFYAMPFVFADKGIHYDKTDDLVYEGKSYPGIKIGYDDGIGASPKDEYYLHYDPTTYRMAWLGYTVTFRSGERSDRIKWIQYNDWMKVGDVLLPKSLTWHAVEDHTIKEARDPLLFENVSLSKTPRPDAFYEMPKNAKVVLKQ